jgi:hypothetical protein
MECNRQTRGKKCRSKTESNPLRTRRGKGLKPADGYSDPPEERPKSPIDSAARDCSPPDDGGRDEAAARRVVRRVTGTESRRGVAYQGAEEGGGDGKKGNARGRPGRCSSEVWEEAREDGQR